MLLKMRQVETQQTCCEAKVENCDKMGGSGRFALETEEEEEEEDEFLK